jgi:hypothetical protein
MGRTPVAVLTLRDRGRGGRESTSLAERVEVESPIGFRPWSADFVMFVHGYNVPLRSAAESYAGFRKHLAHFHARGNFLDLHWPGDLRWGILSAAHYPLRIITAKTGGRYLADWIGAAPEGARFTIVAHSLGCRLVLEAIHQLRAVGNFGRIRAVCLMAAAVPERFIREEQLGPRLSDMTGWHILYSQGDTVLRWAFPAGETDAPFEYAVGLYGQPFERWKQVNASAKEMCHTNGQANFYKHEDYWGGGKRKPAHSMSAEYVGAMLSGTLKRQLPTHKLPPRRALPERFLYSSWNPIAKPMKLFGAL